MAAHSPILHPFVQSLRTHLKNQWADFERLLLLPTECGVDFSLYLQNYRGLLEPSGDYISSSPGREIRAACLEGIVTFFQNLFSGVDFSASRNDTAGSSPVQCLLEDLERSVNLALFYWRGLGDRNYQWRTVVHFFHIAPHAFELFSHGEKTFGMVLSEDGICLGEIEILAAQTFWSPRVFSLSTVSGLDAFPAKPPEEQDISYQRALFARLRSVQQTVFLLIDEWEYLNSLLAVEYGHILNRYQHAPTDTAAEQDLARMTQKINARRNTLAVWSLQTLCDFEEWTAAHMKQLCREGGREDIKAEFQALSALSLAALQKLFLPASVSRMCYDEAFMALCERFSQARLLYMPHDFSTRLLRQAAQSALGKPFDASLLDVLSLKTYEWSVCFDAMPALKAFCWRYHEKVHQILAALNALTCYKKIIPRAVDHVYVLELLNILEAPQGFVSTGHTVFTTEPAIPTAKEQHLYQTLMTLLSSNTKPYADRDLHLKTIASIYHCEESLYEYASPAPASDHGNQTAAGGSDPTGTFAE